MHVLGMFQVLGKDHSFRDAVSRIITHRAANGDPVCSPNTTSEIPKPGGSKCIVPGAERTTGRSVQQRVPDLHVMDRLAHCYGGIR